MVKTQTIVTDIQLLPLIRQSDERTLQQLYAQFREKFITWVVSRYRCDEAQGSEVYQRAFTILYLNIKNGKVVELTATLETYLFGIGKNVIREMFKDKFRMVDSIDDNANWQGIDNNVTEQYEKRHLKTALETTLKKMGEPCSTILKLYYFNQFSMEAIANTVGYKNEAVAKKKKYQCLKFLKEQVDNSPKLKETLLNS